jgi:hypothetical protein
MTNEEFHIQAYLTPFFDRHPWAAFPSDFKAGAYGVPTFPGRHFVEQRLTKAAEQ